MTTEVGTNGATTLACEFLAMCTTCLVECLYYCMPAFVSSRVRVSIRFIVRLDSGYTHAFELLWLSLSHGLISS